MDIKRLNSTDANFWSELDHLLDWEGVSDEAVNTTVKNILKDVRSRGDAALVEYTNQFDRMSATGMADLTLDMDRLEAALNNIPAETREALEE